MKTKLRNRIFIASLSLNAILIALILSMAIHLKYKVYNMLTNSKTYPYVMFGDSITEHCKWHKILRRHNIKNSGTSGHTTRHLLNSVSDKVLKYQPNLCFIMIGINDIHAEIPLHVIQKNYIQLLFILEENNIRPIVQSTLFVNHPNDSTTNMQVMGLNTFLSELSKEKRFAYLDINRLLSENHRLKPEYTSDGTHLNPKAYDVWLAEIEKYIAQQ